MSTALLQELHQEVRRLYIAGSDLAVGDFRLKRLLPQFQQLGERAPIFKRLAEGIASLIEPPAGKEQSSAETLQDIGMLLHSVLYTQGSSAPAGQLTDMESYPSNLSTKLSYRKLAAVQEALTTTGGGRYEVILQAFEDGMFADLRLLQYAIAALGDPYTEIADLTTDKILPSYGSQVVPHLMKTFQIDGGKLEARKLRVIGTVGGEEVAAFIYEAAQSGSDEVRATAIRLLSAYIQYEESVLDWTKEKKKAIRESAYHTLANYGTDRAVARLHEAFASKDIELASDAAAGCDHPQLTAQLVQDLDRDLRAALELADDKKKLDAAWTRIRYVVRALDEKRCAELYDVYSNFVNRYEEYRPFQWLELLHSVAWYMETENSEEALAHLRKIEDLDVRFMSYAVRASFNLLSLEAMYDHYVESMRNKWKMQTNKEMQRRKKELCSTIEARVLSREYVEVPAQWSYSNGMMSLYTTVIQPLPLILAAWDERWLDWFIEQNELELVCAFARPGHERSVKFMLRKLEQHPEFRNTYAGLILSGLKRADAPEEVIWEALVGAIENKKNSNCYTFDGNVFECLYELPASYHARLSLVLPTYKYTAGEQLRYVVEQMEKKQAMIASESV
ncbi:HEAT repeat domain-containing protein [Paenibacillus sp. MER 180]|uniref:HEAT repeat domain-containing protein n=1 Tax=Paenibacillus sp. MER 180 TaxID=2939570 RepID=UPI00203CF1A2|nr:HEAT repeat domain-containing protein [Paenibacillus sp. MER 180]MCM3290457.1 HEAT repeat domain-containing protein [Paenibacillus sp. MER 180]